ncbi:hypothetical protein KKG65_01805 [Patescibacteria group bacterium]|nr:hypothetical protein [Patescibacteria group bacterium]
MDDENVRSNDEDRVVTERSVEYFANQVEGKVIFGKLPADTLLDGEKIVEYPLSFSFHGKDNPLKIEIHKKSLMKKLQGGIYKNVDDLKFLLQRQMVTVMPEDSEGMKVLAVYFFQDTKNSDVGRTGFSPAAYVVRLSAKVADEFVETIKKNPGTLEGFYQRVFSGLDASDGRGGMSRIKADGFYVLNDVEIPEEVSKNKDRSSVLVSFFQNLENSGGYFEYL